MSTEKVNISVYRKLIKIVNATKILAKTNNITPVQASSIINDMAMSYSISIDETIQDIRMDCNMEDLDDGWSAVNNCGDDKPLVEPNDLFTNSDYFKDDSGDCSVAVILGNDVVRKVNLDDFLRFASNVTNYLKGVLNKYGQYEEIVIKNNGYGDKIVPA